MSNTTETFERITARIVSLIENSEARWEKPWQASLSLVIPTNAVTHQPYQGINILALGESALAQGYERNLWATYKQWESIGAQVRKGEHGTQGIKWGRSFTCECGYRGQNPCPKAPRGNGSPKNGHENHAHLWATAFTVFNAAQVDGYELPAIEELTAPERLAAVEDFIAATGATIREIAGDAAFYSPIGDFITVPLAEQFATAEGRYSTILHELTHWTGHASRLDRAQRNAFGSEDYAGEELVAELGAVFLAAHFGIEATPHVNHATYLAHWLRVLRADPMNIYRASKAASEAVGFLLGNAASAAQAEAA